MKEIMDIIISSIIIIHSLLHIQLFPRQYPDLRFLNLQKEGQAKTLSFGLLESQGMLSTS